MAAPAMVRDSVEVWLGLQVQHQFGDPARDLGAVLLQAVEATEPGIIGLTAPPGQGPRFQDLITDTEIDITVHDGFGYWIDDVEEQDAGMAAALGQANGAANPTTRLASVEAAYRTDVGTKVHLRWVLPHSEDALLDALAGLHTAGADDIAEGSRLVGMFRAHGLLAPVGDLQSCPVSSKPNSGQLPSGQENPLQAPLNRNGGTLYRQLARDIERQIHAGEFPADSRLPTEAEFSKRYGVHRLTVRQALSELSRAGLITTIHGRGSFVSARPVPYEVSPGKLASLTQLLAEQGMQLQQRLVGQESGAPPDVLAAFATGGRLERFDQVRELDGQPWALTSTWLDVSRFPDLLDKHWTGEGSLFEALEHGYGVIMHRSTVAFTSVGARAEEAASLQVAAGTPLLLVRGINVDDQDLCVAVAEHRFRGDRVKFSVALH